MQTFKVFFLVFLVSSCFAVGAKAQTKSGTIAGMVADTGSAVLPGARIVVAPGNATGVSDAQGAFTITAVNPGSYNVTISYLGFLSKTMPVIVTPRQTSRISVVLDVASTSDQVVVTADRAHGEAEAINMERTSENILNVLPSDVITSLPNANIADAVGRLPGVTLERDEGEGKYVQIRGTEPRLSNLTIDGVNVPSPEGAVRQVKLDTIPADLVDSVQIYKTLQANQDADAIGGSVNITTKTAGDKPTISLYGAGGFTPIANTVPIAEFAGTVGKRFGANKRLGVMLSGTYDYNGRGIDDLEPVPQILPGTDLTPGFASIDLRQYLYDRSRYGVGGSVGYKISDNSSIFARGLYSDFKDYGHRYDYTISDNPDPTNPQSPAFTTERRLGEFQVGTILLGGNASSDKGYLSYGLSVSRSQNINPINGGESITAFSYIGPNSDCHYSPGTTKSIYRPQFTSACFTDAYNPDNFALSTVGRAAHGKASQLNLQGQASGGKIFHRGSTFNTLEAGVKVRNAHKFDNSYQTNLAPLGTVLMTQFINGFKNSNYYGGSYQYGPTADWEAVNAYIASNPTAFGPDPNNPDTAPPLLGGNSNNFGLVERVSAGYLQNTLSAGRLTFIAGLRLEGTQLHTTSFDSTAGTLTIKGRSSYVDPLPSASLRIALDKNSDLRLVYGRGLSRPDPQFLTTATSLDSSTVPPTLTIGNPALKPEHSNNFDILYSHYLSPIGAIQGGLFYKRLSDPIVQLLSLSTSGPNAGFQVVQAANSGSAYIAGVEINFQQHFTYLPGLMKGLGLSTNYSYTTSQATGVNPGNRTDKPALLRQAPSTLNISPTYDRGRLSLRAGFAYNGANIFLYNYVNGNPGGTKGPGGDQYLFSHAQLDAQGSYRIGKGFEAIVSGLNLNNEPFGFYQGSKPFFIQREYYKPTYTFGFRWSPKPE
jgi:TonB-dependent receptor